MQEQPLVGPHERIELELMRLGVKHVCIAHLYSEEQITEAGFIHRKFEAAQPGRFSDMAYRPGCEWWADKIEKIYAGVRDRDRMTPYDHARIGLILGYTKIQIRAFLERIAGRHSGN